RGGLVDVEFIAQYLMLRDAASSPGIVRANTGEALAALAAAGSPGKAGGDLAGALTLWRRVQSILKLVLDDPAEVDAAPPALQQVLARGAGAVDFAGLKTDMNAAAATVRA